MAMFPWDDLFYHISQKVERAQKLYQTYLHQKDVIGIKGDKLRQKVGDLQILTLEAHALLLNAANGHMNDDDYHQFLIDHEFAQPVKPNSPLAVTVLQGVADLVGFIKFGQTVFRLGKLVKAKWFTGNAEGVGEAAGEDTLPLLSDAAVDAATEAGADATGDAAATSITDAAANAGAEAGSEAAIEATTSAVADASIGASSVACGLGGVFVAIGIDALLGAIEGEEEQEKIDAQLDKLQSGLDVVDKFLARLDGDIERADSLSVDAIGKLKTAIQILDHIQAFIPGHAGYPYPQDVEHVSLWKNAAEAAAGQYFYVSKIRNDFHNYLQNWQKDNPGSSFSHDLFLMWKGFEKESHPPGITKEQAEQFIDYVAKHSEEMGKYA